MGEYKAKIDQTRRLVYGFSFRPMCRRLLK